MRKYGGPPELFRIGVGMHGTHAIWPKQFFGMTTDKLSEFMAVSTQMRSDGWVDDAVHSYTISYSTDKEEARPKKVWYNAAAKFKWYISEGTSPTVFRGNDCTKKPTKFTAGPSSKNDQECKSRGNPVRPTDFKRKFGIVTNEFNPTFKAKSVRVYPKTWGRYPVISMEFFVTAVPFQWNKAINVKSSLHSCDALLKATENAFDAWTEGRDGDGFVWASLPTTITQGVSKRTLTAYRKCSIIGAGKITKELVCIDSENVKTGGKSEKCCTRKTSDSSSRWNRQAVETRLF